MHNFRAGSSRRRRSRLPALVSAVLTSVGAVLAAPPVPALTVDADVHFVATSTLHDFTGEVPRISFRLERGRVGGLWSADVEAAVREMHTGNAWRDANLRRMFDVDRYPTIGAHFEVIDPAIAAGAAGDGSGRLPFVLRIRDVSRPVVGRVRDWRQVEHEVSFSVEFEVSLREFGLEAPSVLGVMHVGDTVRVVVAVVVVDEASAPVHGERVG